MDLNSSTEVVVKKENNFVYTGEFNNVTISANYIVENNNGGDDTDSYGIAAQYAFPFDLSLEIAGYVGGNEGTDIDASQYNLAASYEFNNFLYCSNIFKR